MASEKLFKDAQTLLEMHSRHGISPFFKPIKLVSVQPGEVVFSFEVEDIYMNVSGYFHGGILAVVVDVLTFIAAGTLTDTFHGDSVEMSVRYLKGIRKGETIHVKAEAVRAGKKFFICNADFIDEDGKLAARGSQTIYHTTPSSTSTKHKNLAAKL
ncbi:acyl-coenzyme A thioesterase 13-like [Apostichopus japonicus]|uniref:acyl-coenzyme A thioesterase 13-like n=1 Tax=Stichopus japonicus TaxID=307972 RepID=UPI003AB7FC04